jgi:hypothetical protein
MAMRATSVVNQRIKRKRTPRDLVAIDKTSGPARFHRKLIADIHSDLGGRRQMTRVAEELTEAFAGCATAFRYQLHEIVMGEADLDTSAFATLASTMLRIGVRLGGLRPRQETVPTMDEFLRMRGHLQDDPPEAVDSSDDDADEEEIIPSYAGDGE